MPHPVRAEPAPSRPSRLRIAAAVGGLATVAAVLGAWVWAEARPTPPGTRLAVPAARAEGIVRRTEVAFADAEAVWERAVRATRGEYRKAGLIFFSGAAGTPCAPAPVSGPFYCPEVRGRRVRPGVPRHARRAAEAAARARARALRGAGLGAAPAARARRARPRRAGAGRRPARPARRDRDGAGAAGRLPGRGLGRRRRAAARAGAGGVLEPARLVVAQRRRGPRPRGGRVSRPSSTSSPPAGAPSATSPSPRAMPPAGSPTAG